MKKFSLLVLLILVVLPFRLSADCILDNTDDLNGFTPDPAGTLFGQSFLACETGRINSILLNIQTGGTIDLFITAGNGQLINLQQPHQTFSNVDVSSNKMATFTFEKPFVVAKGELYSIGVRGTMVNYDQSPTIAIDPTADDGQSSFIIAMDGIYTSRPSSDLYFKISSIPLAVATIPIDLGKTEANPTIPAISNGTALANQIIADLGLPAGTYSFSTNPSAGTPITGLVTVTIRNAGGSLVGMAIINFTFNVQPIPTMAQWGLMIFGLLVLNMSVFFVQRRELV